MGRKVLLEGKITFKDCVNIRLDSPALNYGYGLFETLLYENGKIYFLQEHIDRMKGSCATLNIPLPNVNYLKEKLITWLIENNGMSDRPARIKIMYAPLFTTDEWLTVVFNSSYIRQSGPLKVRIDPEPRENPFHRHKTMSYMQNMHHKVVHCELNSYDEVLFLNGKGNISEGTMTSVMCVKENILYYNASSENCLPGVIQEKIVNDSRELGFSDAAAVEGFPFGFLEECSSVLLSNSLMIASEVSELTNKGETVKFRQSGIAEKIRDHYLKN